MKEVTVYIRTDQGYWGLGSTIEQAMKNARVKRGHKMFIDIWHTPYSNIRWNEKIQNHESIDGTAIEISSITKKIYKR